MAATNPLNVLVAEDTPIIAGLVRRLLVKEGHDPTVVANGAEAVAMIQRKVFAVVLMDIQMPELDGISAARSIRRIPGPVGNIPIIALTANTAAHERESYLAAGITDCVTKPIRPDELFRSIASCTLVRELEVTSH